ncbi:MAG: hypothetical protein J6J44_10640 [Lachnospiraceae bacterium]|nr:hypothetical protein [Lachnospiraceae bacterium]
MLRKKKLSRELYLALQKYIELNYIEENREERRAPLFGMRREAKKASFLRPMAVKDSAPMEAPELCEMQMSAAPNYSDFLEDNQSALKERMNHLSDTFQEYLLYLIEEKGLTNAEVYKRALITKQLFSKIKLNPQYHPDKATAMRLCVGASLNLDETKDLLARAGYALSPCDKRDIIFSFFIEHEVHDMIEIDIALEEHGLPCFIE